MTMKGWGAMRPYIVAIIAAVYLDTMPQAKQIEAQEGFAKQSDVDYLKEQIDALRAKFDDMDTGKKKEK